MGSGPVSKESKEASELRRLPDARPDILPSERSPVPAQALPPPLTWKVFLNMAAAAQDAWALGSFRARLWTREVLGRVGEGGRPREFEGADEGWTPDDVAALG